MKIFTVRKIVDKIVAIPCSRGNYQAPSKEILEAVLNGKKKRLTRSMGLRVRLFNGNTWWPMSNIPHDQS